MAQSRLIQRGQTAIGTLAIKNTPRRRKKTLKERDLKEAGPGVHKTRATRRTNRDQEKAIAMSNWLEALGTGTEKKIP